MTDSPLISVIIPVYNVKEYLERCIESVLKQDYENIEVFLVDDGSTDGCAEICDTFSLKDDRVCVIHQKNAGQSAARNAGIRKSSGDYIAFIDSDDFWDEDFLSFLLKLLTENDADISICGVRHIGFPGVKDKEFIEANEVVYVGRDITHNILLGLNGFSASVWRVLFKGDICRKNFFYEGHMYEDIEYMTRISLNISKAVISKKRKYNYFYRPNNSSSTSTLKRLNDLEYVIDKMTQEVEESAPELLPLIDIRFVSNSIWLLRSLHPGEENLFDEIREKILVRGIHVSQLSSWTDRILYFALKCGRRTFKSFNFLRKIYGEIRNLF